MRLESIGNFDWENEPDFNFCEDSIIIKSGKKTDYWQDIRHNINKNSGHFFYTDKTNNFTIIVKWKIPENIPETAQFGIMSKIDSADWCKMSLTKGKDNKTYILSSVTNNNISDFCKYNTINQSPFIYYKMQVIDSIFSLSYSFDGTNFSLLRVFQFIKESQAHKIGAYICNPTEQDFKAVLEEIDVL
ncbi:MAG: DUF1349 domain-containing protein [Alphaproteobacteria bacterium]|nr:DUF1349 domain-containing protein [Alphaproteobacteria bacterium]